MWLLSSCILSYPNFEVIGQSCTAMPREKPQANFLLGCRTFPEMGNLLNHLREKHEWARCRHMPARTQEHHCRLLEFTDSKSAKESSVSPSSCADNNVNEIPFIQWFCWGQVITSLGPACEIAAVRKMWSGYKLISWIAGRTSFRKLSVERCFQHISSVMPR